MIERNPSLVGELAAHTRDEDWLVGQRALDGLATLAQRRARLRPIVEQHVRAFERSSSKALQARARNIRAR